MLSLDLGLLSALFLSLSIFLCHLCGLKLGLFFCLFWMCFNIGHRWSNFDLSQSIILSAFRNCLIVSCCGVVGAKKISGQPFLESQRLENQFLENQFLENQFFWKTSFWKTSIWKTSFWKTSSWKISFWETSFWQTSFWKTSVWQTSFWKTNFWKTSFWKTNIMSKIKNALDDWKPYIKMSFIFQRSYGRRSTSPKKGFVHTNDCESICA